MDLAAKYTCFASYVRPWPFICPAILDQEDLKLASLALNSGSLEYLLITLAI